MMLYKKHEKVRFPDGDTDFFDTVAGVLQGDTLAPYLFSTWLDYRHLTSINLMKLTNYYGRSLRRWHSVSNKCTTPAKFMLYNLEQAAIGIELYENSDKTEYMCLNQNGTFTHIMLVF